MYWWAKFMRDPEKPGRTPDWKEKGRKLPTDFLGSGTVRKTHFIYVSWALEGRFTLQDMLKFIPGISNHRVEGERKSNLPFNELTATSNCTLSITSRQTTGHQLLANAACQMLIPNTIFVVGMWVERSVWGTVQKWNRKAVSFFSCSSYKWTM